MGKVEIAGMSTSSDKYMVAEGCVDDPMFVGSFSECYAWMLAYNINSTVKVRVFILVE